MLEAASCDAGAAAQSLRLATRVSLLLIRKISLSMKVSSCLSSVPVESNAGRLILHLYIYDNAKLDAFAHSPSLTLTLWRLMILSLCKQEFSQYCIKTSANRLRDVWNINICLRTNPTENSEGFSHFTSEVCSGF